MFSPKGACDDRFDFWQMPLLNHLNKWTCGRGGGGHLFGEVFLVCVALTRRKDRVADLKLLVKVYPEYMHTCFGTLHTFCTVILSKGPVQCPFPPPTFLAFFFFFGQFLPALSHLWVLSRPFTTPYGCFEMIAPAMITPFGGLREC